MINIDIGLNLTRKQKEAYDKLTSKDCHTLLAIWSRQSGKSVFAELVLLEYLLKPNTFNAYISPNYAQGRKVFKEIYNLIVQIGIVKKANSSELSIETTYNSTLKFFTIANPTAIRGHTVNGILVLDEAAYFPKKLPNGEDPFGNVILPITKARKPKTLIISTPNGKTGFFYELYLKAKSEEKGFKLVEATIYDDELITPEQIEDIKKTISPIAFKQEFLCEFLDSNITVFPGFEHRFILDNFTYNKCWIGIDPSTVGEDNTVLTVVNEKNDVRQYIIKGTLDSKYKQIADLINRYNPIHTYMEENSIGAVMANEVRKQLNRKSSFSTFITNNESKKDYISLIAVNIANETIQFEKSNTQLYKEMGVFTYKITKSSNITYAAANGYHDDSVISLGLALQCKNDYKMENKPSFVRQNIVITR